MTPNTQSDESVSVDEQRAQWEDFQFTVCRNGYVNVCNKSHNDDSAHTYSVSTAHGSAVSCSCPHYKHRSPEGGCKHMIAVESNPLVLSSATAVGTQPVAADGGHVETDDRFRLPEDPEHISEEEARGVVDVSPCKGCSRLTADDTCGRTRCEGVEVDETPL